MAAFNRYNVRAAAADGSPLYFPNVTIYDNDSLDAYSSRLAGANVRLLSAELIGSSASTALAPVFQDVIRTLPVGVPAGPPMEYAGPVGYTEDVLILVDPDPPRARSKDDDMLLWALPIGVIALAWYLLR